jgi:hypothetical protein
MKEALEELRVPGGPGMSLFLFSTFGDLGAADPLAHRWVDGMGNATHLIGMLGR